MLCHMCTCHPYIYCSWMILFCTTEEGPIGVETSCWLQTAYHMFNAQEFPLAISDMVMNLYPSRVSSLVLYAADKGLHAQNIPQSVVNWYLHVMLRINLPTDLCSLHADVAAKALSIAIVCQGSSQYNFLGLNCVHHWWKRFSYGVASIAALHTQQGRVLGRITVH